MSTTHTAKKQRTFQRGLAAGDIRRFLEKFADDTQIVLRVFDEPGKYYGKPESLPPLTKDILDTQLSIGFQRLRKGKSGHKSFFDMTDEEIKENKYILTFNQMRLTEEELKGIERPEWFEDEAEDKSEAETENPMTA